MGRHGGTESNEDVDQPAGRIAQRVNVPGFLFFLALFAVNLWRARKRRPQPAAA